MFKMKKIIKKLKSEGSSRIAGLKREELSCGDGLELTLLVVRSR